MHSTTDIPLFALLPFVLMLGSIAVLPLAATHFWEKNRNKLLISVLLSMPAIFFLIANHLTVAIVHSLVFDYVPFITLLGALFVITGGIFVDGNIEARPAVNTGILALGAVLASVMGTTGAAMLLIRPLLHTNKGRQYRVHTILFFIGIVANCGGLLTPLGDPPLFMLYLRGVPFTWFFSLFPVWLFVNTLLLTIYFAVDSYYFRRESDEVKLAERTNISPIRIKGRLNFLWLAGVVLAVAFLNKQTFPTLFAGEWAGFIREAVITLLAIFSLKTTPRMVRISNSFTWEPIEEVAYLFLGIFVTMVPCILYLESNAQALGVTTPLHFYFSAGGLSSMLDNTPTAVTFYSLALGLVEQGLTSQHMVAGIPERILWAIAVSAVLFGSLTYIGNGPNFMIKAVAEHNNIKMPSFFRYIFVFALPVLLPVFVLAVWLLL